MRSPVPAATRALSSILGLSVVLGFALAPRSASPAPGAANELIQAAEAALKKGSPAEAIELATKAIAADSREPRAYFLRGRAYQGTRNHAKAVADYDAGLKLNPRTTMAYQYRGEEHFRLGNFKESVADFDKFIELAPTQSLHHWQRGISLYYAGRFEDGRKQFELHQTVNANDVENAAWHYLCAARVSGVEKAREALIPIEQDGRVPMMQVHALFAGKAKADDVFAAAKAGNPPPAELDNRLFYAHLYLGLYHEAAGNIKLAREHIFKAAADFKADHYMGDVARVHAQVLRRQMK
jgi:lipoprotein NlpI